MLAKQCLCFNNNIIQGEELMPVKCINAPCGLGCCQFYVGGFIVVDALFIVDPIVCGAMSGYLFC